MSDQGSYVRYSEGVEVRSSDEGAVISTAAVAHPRDRGAEFELRVQLRTSLDRMPVEDASTRWPEDESPYVAVARPVLPRQEAHSPARQAYLNEALLFRPGHSLQVHRPLGSITRARLATYAALSAHRRGRNGQAEQERRSPDEAPD